MKIFSKKKRNDVKTLTCWRREGYTSNLGWDLDFMWRREGHTPFIAEKEMRLQPWPSEDERATNLNWRSRSCIERIIAPNIRLTVNQRVTPNNMRPGSCIERITVSSLQTLYREGLLINHVRSRSCIEKITNLHWRCRSCTEGIITPNIRLTVNQRVTPNNMRPGSCIERITVSSLQALYRESLLSLENSALASFDQHYYENACMNACKLW